jgi:predicted exporter
VTPMGERLARAARFLSRGRWLVPALALAAAVVVATRERLWDMDLASLNPISARDREHDARMRADLGAADARVMVAARGASEEAALQAAERLGARLDALVASGTLGGYESPAGILPSAATQQARRASLPEREALRGRLAVALKGSPLAAAKLGPFLDDVERARAEPPLTRAALANTAMATALEGLLFADTSGRWTALVGLRPSGTSGIDTAAVRKALAGSDALVIDLKAEADRLYAGYLERALIASAAGLAVIVGLLAFALRDAGRVARVMTPLLAGVLVVAAVHALAGVRLGLLHLVGLLLVVAIGSNYALFFDKMSRSADSAARTLASLVLANVTTVASFGVLALSDIPVLRAMGSTVSLGAFATLVLSAMLFRPGVTIPQGKRQT